MRFTTASASALLASMVTAAPAPAPAESKDMMASATQWTIESLVRTCTSDNVACTWDFSINTGAGAPPTACEFSVSGQPASQTSLTTPAVCSNFSITTGWSDQFGADQGFTTLAVVDNADRLIVYPAYTDAQLVNATVVVPDQSYTPAALP